MTLNKSTFSRRTSIKLAGAFGATAMIAPATFAQDATPPAGTPVASPVAAEATITTIMSAQIEQLPQAPFTVRMLRITLQPGSITPMHTHHGPEIDLVESGEVTIRSQGDAPVTRADGTEEVSSGDEVTLVTGDMVHFPAEIGMFFENTGDAPAVMLSAVLIPVGPDFINERITWLEGEPNLEGVSYQKLGDGLMQDLEQQPAEWVVTNAVLPAGFEVPALAGVSMVTPVEGNYSFTIDAGQVQVTRGDSTMLQPNAVLGTSFSLGDADAAFFPNGVTATPRTEEANPLTLLMMDIIPANGAAAAPAELTFSAGDGTVAGGSTEPQPGQIVTTTDDNVNLRAEPSVNGEIVDQLAAGVELEVIGGPTEADDYVWYQVRVTSEGGSEGWAVADFLSGVSAATEEAPAPEAEAESTPTTGQFAVGSSVVTIEENVRLRPEPNTGSEAIDVLPLGTALTVTGETESGDEFTWVPVETADGLTGYVVTDFIEAAPE